MIEVESLRQWWLSNCKVDIDGPKAFSDRALSLFVRGNVNDVFHLPLETSSYDSNFGCEETVPICRTKFPI